MDGKKIIEQLEKEVVNPKQDKPLTIRTKEIS